MDLCGSQTRTRTVVRFTVCSFHISIYGDGWIDGLHTAHEQVRAVYHRCCWSMPLLLLPPGGSQIVYVRGIHPTPDLCHRRVDVGVDGKDEKKASGILYWKCWCLYACAAAAFSNSSCSVAPGPYIPLCYVAMAIQLHRLYTLYECVCKIGKWMCGQYVRNVFPFPMR